MTIGNNARSYACSFTEAHYREILQALRAAGYCFTSFSEFDPAASYQIILRHDVDLSLEEAVRIAHLEAEMCISAVYEVLLTAETYNVLSAMGQAQVREIRQLGHRIGLHVDTLAIEGGQGDASVFYCRLQELFEMGEKVLGPLDSYTLHRPAGTGKMEALDPEYLPFPVPPYGYARLYRERILYRSDSRRQWQYGCVCTQIEAWCGRSVHLLTHPIWWPAEALTREAVLWRYVELQKAVAESYLESNLPFYSRGVKKK